MKVNNFPSLTWNFLKINNASLESVEGIQAEPSVSLVDGVAACGADGSFASIATGMGAEFDAAFDELKLKARKFSVAAGKKTDTVRVVYSAENDSCVDEIQIAAGEGSESNFIFAFKSAEGFDGTIGAVSYTHLTLPTKA